MDQQESFGEESDILKEFIFLAIDRDENCNFIKKMNDIIKINKSVHDFDFKKIGL